MKRCFDLDRMALGESGVQIPGDMIQLNHMNNIRAEDNEQLAT
jgi:hypothetical protein